MTQEMYGATGRVGNKTYYRSNGKTIAREVVTPKNPKTDAQTIQRITHLDKSAIFAICHFGGVCDHIALTHYFPYFHTKIKSMLVKHKKGHVYVRHTLSRSFQSVDCVRGIVTITLESSFHSRC